MRPEINSDFAYKQLKNFWNKSWSRPDYNPTWRISKIPHELQVAVDTGWFLPHSSLLDIGCGSGEIAAGLAEKNFNVLGIDWAEAAIQKAKLKQGEVQGKLTFKTIDICREKAKYPEFDILIDRGCFDGLPKAFYSDYANTVASYAKSGAKFLLISSFNKGAKSEVEADDKLREDMINYIKAVFIPLFEIIKIETTVIEKRPVSVPALAVWMIRH
ncbi:MAG: methyltransferase domain-containing protein [Microcoleaceae cyanobacterium]